MNGLIKSAKKIIQENNPNDYYKIYETYETKYWEHIPTMIESHVDGKQINNVLDIGAAYGTILMYMHILIPEAKLSVIDNTEYMSMELRNKYRIQYIKDTIENLQWKPKTRFDVIIFTEVLEHLNFNPFKTLCTLRDLLTEDGAIFLSTPDSTYHGKLTQYSSWLNMPIYNDRVMIVDDHIYQYNIEELRYLCDIAGLKIECEQLSSLKHINVKIVKK